MAPKTDLRSLAKREHQLKGVLAGVQRFIDDYQPEEHEIQIGVRIQGLDSAMSEFYDVHSQIDLLVEDARESKTALEIEVDTTDEVLHEFEDKYYSLKAKLVQLQSPLQRATASSSQHQPAQSATYSKMKLPEIRLPSFDGEFRKWVTFRDTFNSLIQSKEQLTDMDKFTYLKSALSGNALREIDSIALSENNYSVAWTTLKARYENKKLIVKAHLDALFSVEPLRKESYDGLNHLVTEFEKNLLMLDQIGEKTAEWSTILAYMVCSKLDSRTLRHWEVRHSSNEVPKYAEVIEFLRCQCSVLQSVAPVKAVDQEQRPVKSSVCHTMVKTSGKCSFCNEVWHSPFQCAKFQRMKVADRAEAVNSSRLCRNCLRPGHFAARCERGYCRHCHQKHHSMLHNPSSRSSVPQSPQRSQTPGHQSRQSYQSRQIQQQPRQSQQQQQPTQQNQQTNTSNTTYRNTTANDTPQDSHIPSTTDHATTSQNCVALPTTPTQTILLSTALVKIKDQFGNSLLARALLDSCSQHCLMSRAFSKKLKFREFPSYLSIQGIGNSPVSSSKLVSAAVSPRSTTISSFAEEMDFHVLPKLTVQLPVVSVDPANWDLPETALLADPRFHERGPIDLIIGAEFYLNLLKQDRRLATSGGPILQDTVLGWIISGRASNAVSSHSQQSHAYICSNSELQEQLVKFWELETCRATNMHSAEESACEEFFERTTTRDSEGRFVVELPKKDFIMEQLGDSSTIAVRRFLGTERRLQANPELKKQYSEFIHEYLELGHMELITEDSTEGKVYHMPHHAVLRPDSTTTQLRVVFDASCKSSTGVSLNDALMVGPVVQDDLLDIVLRVRFHPIAVVADVEKMYRMVQVKKTDQPLQRILWRDEPEEDIRTYQLTTVTYGTASAPYLATKCLQKLAQEGEQTHPIAAKVLKRDFYVDDLLSGVDSIAEGKALVKELVELLKSAGFSLRKWNSNNQELLRQVPEHLRDKRSILQLDSAGVRIKTLGVLWDPSTDTFRFNIPKWNSSKDITKRIVISDASLLFDPYGLVGPVIVQAKLLIQDLWQREFDWDTVLPSDLQDLWREFRRNLVALDSLSIPRWIAMANNTITVHIHGFCDASEKAYGACLYVRTVSETRVVATHLLMSKSRIAPLESLKKKTKRPTIPRLELSSALLLAHIFERVVKNIDFKAEFFFWTDSMIVMYWLLSLPSRWKAFIGNRVSEVQDITKDGVWNHVPGIENPADIISRGMTPAQLQYSSLWFHGPSWLMLDDRNWPKVQPVREQQIEPSLLEERSITAVLQATAPSGIFGLRSWFPKLVRLYALILRFRYNRIRQYVGPVSEEEFDHAMKALVRIAQQDCFPQEVADLTAGRSVNSSSKLLALNPQMIDGILCVGGRLQYAAVSESRKHPYILDHRHPFTRMIVTYHHIKYYHAGQQTLIAILRQRFWPTNVRTLVRSVIHSCVQCFRIRPTIQNQLMADLPPERVTPCIPFRKTGLDYCGPFMIAYPYRRCRPVKIFIAIYVCLVTKAVHLEIVADLTTQAFLASLKRFTSQRGKPNEIMCDNATTFVGARRELDELQRLFNNQQFRDAVVTDAAEDKIQFRFIPPRTPNFGGLWETAVKSFKTLFKRTIGTQTLLYDEMHTVIKQIEAILNSRPLTPISNDPGDFEALTPGHFLIQRPLTAIPEPDLDGIPDNRLSAYQRVQRFMQTIWKIWSGRYLSDLHNRTKWRLQKNNITVGTLVVLREDNLPPLKWCLARITAVHPGPDGKVRVFTLKTKDGTFDRGISKISVLPIRDNFDHQGEH